MKWTHGVVKAKQIWASGLFTLQVHAPGVDSFEPGQFLQLGIDQPDGHLHRPYSVASPHSEILDFYIVLVEDGKLTPHLSRMDVGDSLDISQKAAGSFTLSHCPGGETLWLIATGTGLAPYIAMLRDEAIWKRYPSINVVHGVRYMQDLSYVEELASYETMYRGRFRYLPVVSREQGENMLKGRITHCLGDGTLEAKAGKTFSTDDCVMMCGNPDMLTDLETQLAERGLTKHKRKEPGQIVVERYW
ncbi:MAG: ferredoxin--NADP(+) reductase [Aureliella sp.]